MHNSEFPSLNRNITIDNPIYYITIILVFYGHVTFVAFKSCQNLEGIGYGQRVPPTGNDFTNTSYISGVLCFANT